MSDTAGAAGLGASDRRDAWWAAPAATALGLGAFIVYSTWAAFQGAHYFTDPYLSPFYSPVLWGEHGWLGAAAPSWWPSWVPAYSPAFLILWVPAGFRFTCYYYRKAYYRAYFLDPAACGVDESRHAYRGETRILLFQNLHRYFLYLALVLIFILWVDAFKAYVHEDGVHVNVGSLVLTANAFLLMMYTLSCHSFRHLIGGCIDCLQVARCGALRHRLWKSVSCFNERHMLYAWTSLFMVGVADLYVRLCSMGVLRDLRIL